MGAKQTIHSGTESGVHFVCGMRDESAAGRCKIGGVHGCARPRRPARRNRGAVLLLVHASSAPAHFLRFSTRCVSSSSPCRCSCACGVAAGDMASIAAAQHQLLRRLHIPLLQAGRQRGSMNTCVGGRLITTTAEDPSK